MSNLDISIKPEPPKLAVDALSSSLGLSRLLVELLHSRGYQEAATAKSFLAPSLARDLPDPAEIIGCEAACELILDAAESNKKIGIVSDFDVDGTTACAQLSSFLDAIQAVHHIYIPDRLTDGYGLNKFAIDEMKARGVSLLVTLDCGISNVEEISYAKEQGMQTVVIDHHQLPNETPDADVILNPAQDGCPFQEFQLCAAGLVWVMLIRLRSKFAERKDLPKEQVADLKSFLDLAAIGTICDMVPLNSVNRLIAKKGVEQLRSTNRVGLQSMMEKAGVFPAKLTAGSVGWVLGPRINAAGRIENAAQVVELFRTSSKNLANSVADKLEQLNRTRKSVEAKMLEAALERSSPASEDRAVLVFDESFHVGVIGIVASRLVEQFHIPAAVMAPSPDDKELIKGSVRSVRGFDVSEALKLLRPLLEAGGGHAMAGGFTVARSNLASFEVSFRELAKEALGPNHKKQISVDCELSFKDLTYTAVTELSLLEPFGIGNPRPVFLTRAVKIKTLREVGDNHLKLELSDSSASLTAMYWRMADKFRFRVGDKIDIVYSPELNNYRGIESVQLQLKEALESA